MWGTDWTSSHRALSLVQIHPGGHLGCLSFRASAAEIRLLTAATHTSSVHPPHPLSAVPGYPISSAPLQEDSSLTCNLRGIESVCFRSPFVCLNDQTRCMLQACLYASCVSIGKAPVQRIRFAGSRITNAGQTRHAWQQRAVWVFSFLIIKTNQPTVPCGISGRQ